jgi:hypothetical protein
VTNGEGCVHVYADGGEGSGPFNAHNTDEVELDGATALANGIVWVARSP